MKTKLEKKFPIISIESIRFVDVQVEKIWSEINNLENWSKFQIYSKESKLIEGTQLELNSEFLEDGKFKSKITEFENLKLIVWEGKSSFTKIKQTWEFEKISYKRTKIISKRSYSNIFLWLSNIFIKRSLQKKLDKTVENLILALI